MPLCILGVPHSGTAIIARILNELDVYFGSNDTLIFSDTHTHLQHSKLLAFNDDILEMLGGDWLNPPNLSDSWYTSPPFKSMTHRVQGLLPIFDGYENWAWHDPRNTLTIPFWKHILPELKIVFCLRNPDRNALSLAEDDDTPLDYGAGLELWRIYHEWMVQFLGPGDYITTQYETLAYDPEAEIRRLATALEIPASDEQIHNAVEAIAACPLDPYQPVALLAEKAIPESIYQHYVAFLSNAGGVYEQLAQDAAYQANSMHNELVNLQGEVTRIHQRLNDAEIHFNWQLETLHSHYQSEQQKLEHQLLEGHEEELANLRQSLKDDFAEQEQAVKQAHENAIAQVRRELSEQLREQETELHQNYQTELKTIRQQVQQEVDDYEDLLAKLTSDYEAKVDTLETDISDYTSQKEALERQLQMKRSELGELQSRLKASESELANIRSENEKQLAYIKELEQQLVDMSQVLNDRTTEITMLRNTVGWRVIKAMGRMRNRVFPEQSFRRRVYDRLAGASKNRLPVPAARAWEPPKRDVEPVDQSAIIESGGFLHYPALDYDYKLLLTSTEPRDSDLRQQQEISKTWENRPLISLVTPVYNTPLELLRETIHSVQTQTYDKWEWHILDGSPEEEVWNFINEAAENDARIRPKRLQKNRGIAHNTNVGLKAAQGAYVALLDHDDILTPNAFYEIVVAIHEYNAPDLIYSDEDKLDELGYRVEPNFKPNWSPDMMFCNNLITHLCAFKREFIERIGLMNPETDGAQDWDYFFRITETTDHIHHIPKILYHWRKHALSTAAAATNKSVKPSQTRAIMGHMQRTGLQDPKVHFLPTHPIHRVHPLVTWKQQHPRKVSIIIPSINHADMLGRCLKTLFKKTKYKHYEVIVVDTGSTEPATFDLYRRYETTGKFRVVEYKDTFNFSKACNFGVQHAHGELLLFLNNDVEITEGDWLELMAMWFERKGVGMVGAHLLYPNGRTQHAGVIVGMSSTAGHVFINQPPNYISKKFGNDVWYRNLLAVTGACLMISREVFDIVDGWDEGFNLNYSDVDLGINVHEAGYRIVFTPHARLIHHESTTHGKVVYRSDFIRAAERWRKYLVDGDPYFNPNLSYSEPTPHFRKSDEDTGYHLNQKLLQRLPDKEQFNMKTGLLPKSVLKEGAPTP